MAKTLSFRQKAALKIAQAKSAAKRKLKSGKSSIKMKFQKAGGNRMKVKLKVGAKKMLSKGKASVKAGVKSAKAGVKSAKAGIKKGATKVKNKAGGTGAMRLKLKARKQVTKAKGQIASVVGKTRKFTKGGGYKKTVVKAQNKLATAGTKVRNELASAGNSITTSVRVGKAKTKIGKAFARAQGGQRQGTINASGKKSSFITAGKNAKRTASLSKRDTGKKISNVSTAKSSVKNLFRKTSKATAANPTSSTGKIFKPKFKAATKRRSMSPTPAPKKSVRKPTTKFSLPHKTAKKTAINTELPHKKKK